GRGGVLNYHPLVVKAKEMKKKGHELLRTYGTTGIQTPIRVRDGQLVGTKRLHDPTNDWGEIEGHEVQGMWLHAFGTHSGKAILLKSPWKFAGWIQYYEAIKPRADKGEIWVTNGRINESWQSGFDDLRKPYLMHRWPANFLIVNTNDAKARGIESGDWVEVHNDTVYVQMGQPQGVLDADLTFNQLMKDGHIMTTEARFQAVAVVSDEIREGVAKTNFNFTTSPGNSVVSAVPDPMTNNYRYKLGRGTLRKVGDSKYKTSFTHMSLKPRPIV
ncbi:MAG: arsenite oxidase large subunit, partial [Alphaproteobacteria bacterium]|nr:arsenite oxidase large subunit [Alphaproteobacteria bacterium]